MLLIFVFQTEGERDKFERVYHKYKNLMLHKAYGVLRDPMLAEDAVSEAFIRIYKNLRKIDDPESPRAAAFVAIIAKNCALTLLQKVKGVAADELDESMPDPGDVEEDALSSLAASEVGRALGALSEEDRGVFLLKYAYDLSHKEIGRLLGKTENSVTVRLHRVKRKLAALLEKEGFSLEA